MITNRHRASGISISRKRMTGPLIEIERPPPLVELHRVASSSVAATSRHGSSTADGTICHGLLRLP